MTNFTVKVAARRSRRPDCPKYKTSMTDQSWTADELERIGAARSLRWPRSAGTERAPAGTDLGGPGRRGAVRPLLARDRRWLVPRRAGQPRRARSRGWRRAGRRPRRAAGDDVNDAVDAAYRDKYGRYPSYVEPMVRAEAQTTTLRLVPAGDEHHRRS